MYKKFLWNINLIWKGKIKFLSGGENINLSGILFNIWWKYYFTGRNFCGEKPPLVFLHFLAMFTKLNPCEKESRIFFPVKIHFYSWSPKFISCEKDLVMAIWKSKTLIFFFVKVYPCKVHILPMMLSFSVKFSRKYINMLNLAVFGKVCFNSYCNVKFLTL